MSAEAILPLHIDSTMISAFRSCPEKFKNEFVLGLRGSQKSIDLHAGGCFSSAVERFYEAIWVEGVDHQTALARSYGTFIEKWGDFEIPESKKTPKSKENMWEAVEDYFRTYPPHTDHVQPFFNADGKPTFEFSFAIPLEPAVEIPYKEYRSVGPEETNLFPLHPSGAPFVYCGRLDLLGLWNGKIVGRDEKTSARLASNWSEQWDLRSQFLGYCWSMQQYGLDVDTIVARGIIINQTSIRQVEAIKTYPHFLIEKWYEQLRRDLWRIRRAWDEGYWDVNLSESCTAYSHCQFMPMCTSPNPERWHSNYVVSRWNPLNRGEATATTVPPPPQSPRGSDGPPTAARPASDLGSPPTKAAGSDAADAPSPSSSEP